MCIVLYENSYYENHIINGKRVTPGEYTAQVDVFLRLLYITVKESHIEVCNMQDTKSEVHYFKKTLNIKIVWVIK